MTLSSTQISQINRRIRINRIAASITLTVILHIFVGLPLAPLLIFVDHRISLPLAILVYLSLLAWITSRLWRYRHPDVSAFDIVTLQARFSFTIQHSYRHYQKRYHFGPYPIDAANNPDRWFRAKQPLKLHTPYRVKAIRIPWDDTAELSYYLLEETFEELPLGAVL